MTIGTQLYTVSATVDNHLIYKDEQSVTLLPSHHINVIAGP